MFRACESCVFRSDKPRFVTPPYQLSYKSARSQASAWERYLEALASLIA
jgi:hypothetical protein